MGKVAASFEGLSKLANQHSFLKIHGLKLSVEDVCPYRKNSKTGPLLPDGYVFNTEIDSHQAVPKLE